MKDTSAVVSGNQLTVDNDNLFSESDGDTSPTESPKSRRN
jgi:hypothetical protein